ncbi:MAG: acetyl-CoA carboxylase carboxyltransferase subunit alpha [Bacteroidetes bacterium]|nr:acetyl-CoA carboxylase carboxyltransferase subunit alpha [Bacteroidota bacterium]MCA6444893.1 acetyl-CoA carboxylase carboxyltransferase subunit alpha [Bacteroidota bacterium]
MTYLDFEKPIQDLEGELVKLREVNSKSKVKLDDKVKELEDEIVSKTKELYSSLTPWQRVQVSRHPERPYTLAYIDSISNKTFIELHGDRTVADDKAMVGGFGEIDGQTVMFIGQQKGINTKMRQIRRFGMANPEGYRKALRLMKLAEKFNKPIVTFIDTPGAYPGLEAEERGQGEAIARNLLEMCQLKVPVICIIIGEGASGGALGIGIGDKVLMLENTWYSVISPESCSSILWRSWNFKEKAAEALKLTATDMKKNGLIDGVIEEPIGGAHRNPEQIFENVKSEIKKHLKDLELLSPQQRIDSRIEKFSSMGVVHDLND